jgi:hypothetical protein
LAAMPAAGALAAAAAVSRAPRNVVGGVDGARNRARIARGGGGFVWLECARGSIAVTPCAHASHEGQVHTHSPPSRRHSASLNDSELARRRWFYEKNETINLLLRPSAAPTKKTTKRRPSVHVLLIVRPLTVANFPIDRPALLEINRKIATMGGGDYHLGKKGPLFVRRLSVFGCSQFPPEQKNWKRGQKKKNGGNEWTGPPITSSHQLPKT